ncbi:MULTISPECIES: hypothetical protein [Roseomonadaceae]|uniref:Secreted protein n=1 Tax=Falsiroseomonas oleicola TaxID=2801474 RepID=A0ABS6H4B3_9PROT|nr:hypothetical protein [Roseomonas oleicola]MBU8543513.1 hypothetical protein [Roseomonas oleicola]
MWRILAVLLLLLTAPPAWAEAPPPACTAAREGTVACIAGKLCTCGFVRGGSMTGRPDRFTWDCGILRPACGSGLVPPSATPQPMPMPDLLLQPGWGNERRYR